MREFKIFKIIIDTVHYVSNTDHWFIIVDYKYINKIQKNPDEVSVNFYASTWINR